MDVSLLSSRDFVISNLDRAYEAAWLPFRHKISLFLATFLKLPTKAIGKELCTIANIANIVNILT
jgi:hypothetical protein